MPDRRSPWKEGGAREQIKPTVSSSISLSSLHIQGPTALSCWVTDNICGAAMMEDGGLFVPSFLSYFSPFSSLFSEFNREILSNKQKLMHSAYTEMIILPEIILQAYCCLLQFKNRLTKALTETLLWRDCQF